MTLHDAVKNIEMADAKLVRMQMKFAQLNHEPFVEAFDSILSDIRSAGALIAEHRCDSFISEALNSNDGVYRP